MKNGIEFLLEKACYCEADGIMPSYAVPYTVDGEHIGVKIMDIGTYATKLNEAGLLEIASE